MRQLKGPGFTALKRGLAFVTKSLRALAHQQQGATAVFVALAIIPLVAFVGLAVDTTRGYLVKSRLNQALDAAALAGGRVYANSTRDDDIRMYFKANFPDGYLGSVASPVEITPNDIDKTLTVSAQATLPTTFMHLLNINTVQVASSAQVIVESQNVEVAMVLDITGSMDASDSMDDLKDAANDLVDIVVNDVQSPFYSKVAMVPFSMTVNVGGYSSGLTDQVRGTPPEAKAITNIEKLGTTSSTRKIKITAVGHGFANGAKIFISGVSAGFSNRINNSVTGTYNSTNAPNFWTVGEVTTDTFVLKRANGNDIDWDPSGTSNDWNGSYSNGGGISCMVNRCPYLAFQRDSDGAWQTWILNGDCVTERVGANVATDAAPSVTPVGTRYQPSSGSGNDCVDSAIVPLTSDKSLLHTKINALSANGSTAGQIGTAWGWYMLSPNFASLWPADSQPAAYGTPKLLKVAIIMTDGDFNTIYNNGVIAQDSGSGSGGSNYKINQNGTNGSGFTQAKNLCAAMKAPAPGPNIEIYTVGLGLSGSSAAVDFLSKCATSSSHMYLPNSGTELQDAFHDIAQKISKLRLTK
jgi:Flp pilus assembly protein TadG